RSGGTGRTSSAAAGGRRPRGVMMEAIPSSRQSLLLGTPSCFIPDVLPFARFDGHVKVSRALVRCLRPTRLRRRGRVRDDEGQGGATMTDLMDLHREAMRFVDHALRLRREGDPHGAQEQFRKALDCESRAAAMAAPDVALEPTRSVLHRSAASL